MAGIIMEALGQLKRRDELDELIDLLKQRIQLLAGTTYASKTATP